MRSLKGIKLQLIGVALFVAGSCSLTNADQCSALPPEFLDPNDNSFWEGRAVPIDLPNVNVVKVSRSGIPSWNGSPLSSPEEERLVELESYLRVTAELTPQPLISLDVEDGAPCETIDVIRSLIEKHYDCRSSRACLCGPAPF